MNFSFDEKKHIYYLDDKKLTGVTSIIGVLAKPALISWSARMAADYLDGAVKEIAIHADWEAMLSDGTWDKLVVDSKNAHTKKKEAAGEHGTDAHALVEEWINECLEHGGSPFAAAAGNAHETIGKVVQWASQNVDHFLFAERRMYWADPYWIAGTADFAYVGKDGKRYMADFKTSSGIYGVDYWLQVAAYRMLAEHAGDEPYDGATVVRLGKDGSFEVQQRFDYETDKEAFLACLTLYRAGQTYTKAKK